MDISNTKSVAEREEEGTVVDVKDATGEKQKGVTITVMGTYSSTYRRAVAANRDRILKQRRATVDGDQLEQQAIETAASCIKAWTGFTAGDKPYPLTKANAVALLTNAPWIREQVEEAMNDHASFFPKPSAA